MLSLGSSRNVRVERIRGVNPEGGSAEARTSAPFFSRAARRSSSAPVGFVHFSSESDSTVKRRRFEGRLRRFPEES